MSCNRHPLHNIKAIIWFRLRIGLYASYIAEKLSIHVKTIAPNFRNHYRPFKITPSTKTKQNTFKTIISFPQKYSILLPILMEIAIFEIPKTIPQGMMSTSCVLNSFRGHADAYAPTQKTGDQLGIRAERRVGRRAARRDVRAVRRGGRRAEPKDGKLEP